MKKAKKFKCDGETFLIETDNYVSDGRLLLAVCSNDKQCYCVLTADLPELSTFSEDEGYINITMDKKLVNKLKGLGIIEESYESFEYKSELYERVKFNTTLLKQFTVSSNEEYQNSDIPL